MATEGISEVKHECGIAAVETIAGISSEKTWLKFRSGVTIVAGSIVLLELNRFTGNFKRCLDLSSFAGSFVVLHFTVPVQSSGSRDPPFF